VPQSIVSPASGQRAALTEALTNILESHAVQHRPFSAWENHCLVLALAALRVGSYDLALRRIEDLRRPLDLLPAFPLPPTLTLDDLRQAIGRFVVTSGGMADAAHGIGH
jgi:hypothetical protein